MQRTKAAIYGLLAAILLCAPAHAAITQVSGSGTGGNIGNVVGSGASSYVITTNVSVPAGSLIVVGGSVRTTAANMTGCSDSAGNTYAAPSNRAAASNTDVGMTYSILGTTLPSGGTITCTTSSTTNFMAYASAWAGVASSGTLDPATPTSGIGTATNMAAGPSGTLAFPGTTELIVGFAAPFSSGGITEDAAFTSLGTNTGTAVGHMGYKIVSSNAAITYTPVNASSVIFATMFMAFEQAVSAASTNRLLMRGAP